VTAARFRELLARWLGWSFDDKDAAQLDQVMRDRAAAHALSPAAYLDRLDAGPWPAEIHELTECLSITETYFFRHGEQLRALREVALPERLRAQEAPRTLRLLSVGCSSGEEAYTLAMLAREARPDPGWIISVVGLDANPAMLRRAAGGRYSSWSLRDAPDGLRRRWFRPDGDAYRVTAEIRSLVRFRQHNVAGDDEQLWLPQYDVIFCRNLLMYLTAPAAAALVRRMTAALLQGGYLFLGHTDSLGKDPAGLEARHSHHAFYYRRIADPAPARPSAGLAGVARARAGPAAPVAEHRTYSGVVALLHAERYAEALELFTASQPGRPRRCDGLLHGVLLAQTGRLGEAAAVARRLIEADGLYADAHQLLGLCLEDEHAVDDAVRQYRLAAYLDAGFAAPRLRLGQLARRRGDDRAAAFELELALDLLAREDEDRITLFGGGFGRIALTAFCRSELDSCGAQR